VRKWESERVRNNDVPEDATPLVLRAKFFQMDVFDKQKKGCERRRK
jgi:hypothetical protein